MSQELALHDEIHRALGRLSADDRKRIKPEKAEKVFKTLVEKLARIRDSGEAIQNTLSELYVGATGQEERRRKVFTAYWRLLVRLRDNRENSRPRGRNRRAT